MSRDVVVSCDVTMSLDATVLLDISVLRYKTLQLPSKLNGQIVDTLSTVPIKKLNKSCNNFTAFDGMSKPGEFFSQTFALNNIIISIAQDRIISCQDLKMLTVSVKANQHAHNCIMLVPSLDVKTNIFRRISEHSV